MPGAARLALPVCTLILLLPCGIRSQGLPANAAELVLPRGTPVKLQLAQTISSAVARKGDRVEFVVAKDIDVDGFRIIRAGARAEGTVAAVRGKRPMGMGGAVILQLDSMELTNGQQAGLLARKEFKGRSHTIRMAVGMAVTAAFYAPVAPVFLLTRGRDCTVLKGTEVTAYTKGDTSLLTAELPVAGENASALNEMMKLLPPRVMNGEGRSGDMLNLIFLAKEADLRESFARAGWLTVEKSKPRIIWHLMWQRMHYTKLPMDRLYVFGRAQDFSYALPDPKSIVARRHHLRIWKTDHVVNGVPLWVAAATHDVSIQFVKHKFRLFHRIDPNVDAERDFIAGNLEETRLLSRESYLRSAEPVFTAQTATGQAYYSDSRILFLELKPAVTPAGGTAEVVGGSR